MVWFAKLSLKIDREHAGRGRIRRRIEHRGCAVASNGE